MKKNLGLILLLCLFAILSSCTPAQPTAIATEVQVFAPTDTTTPTASPSPSLVPTSTPIFLIPGQEAIKDISLNDSISLVGRWRFMKVDVFNMDLVKPAFNDSSWGEIDAPATWETQGLTDLIGTGAVVVYRLQVEVPLEWQGKPVGVNTWFNPFSGRVFVNGEVVEPLRKPFAPYADVSQLLKYGEINTIAVAVQYDGYLEFTGIGPPLLGIITERPVTKVIHEDLKIPGPNGEIDATLIHPEIGEAMPALVLDATGSHGMAERESWFDLADDLARQGVVSLVLALKQQDAPGIQAGIEYLRNQEMVDPQRIILFGVDQAASAVATAAIQDPVIRGLILLSPAPVKNIADLGARPALFMASVQDRRGMLLQSCQDMASSLGVTGQVVALPGDGHGTFVFGTVWNQVRTALMDFLKLCTG